MEALARAVGTCVASNDRDGAIAAITRWLKDIPDTIPKGEFCSFLKKMIEHATPTGTMVSTNSPPPTTRAMSPDGVGKGKPTTPPTSVALSVPSDGDGTASLDGGGGDDTNTSAGGGGDAVSSDSSDWTCDGCNEDLTKTDDRFRCTKKECDYDLCSTCNSSGQHKHEHPLINVNEKRPPRRPAAILGQLDRIVRDLDQKAAEEEAKKQEKEIERQKKARRKQKEAARKQKEAARKAEMAALAAAGSAMANGGGQAPPSPSLVAQLPPAPTGRPGANLFRRLRQLDTVKSKIRDKVEKGGCDALRAPRFKFKKIREDALVERLPADASAEALPGLIRDSDRRFGAGKSLASAHKYVRIPWFC